MKPATLLRHVLSFALLYVFFAAMAHLPDTTAKGIWMILAPYPVIFLLVKIYEDTDPAWTSFLLHVSWFAILVIVMAHADKIGYEEIYERNGKYGTRNYFTRIRFTPPVYSRITRCEAVLDCWAKGHDDKYDAGLIEDNRRIFCYETPGRATFKLENKWKPVSIACDSFRYEKFTKTLASARVYKNIDVVACFVGGEKSLRTFDGKIPGRNMKFIEIDDSYSDSAL